jgi:tetratricopeptide (TPR) repeat protein
MQTRFSRICDAIIEAGWLAALVVAPLFFNTFSNRVFEPDKIHLVRSIALLIAVAWLAQIVDGGIRRQDDAPRSPWAWIRATPLVLPALILLASYIISTAFSLVPRLSFFGSYVRLQGTLTFASYLVIFGAVLTHLRARRQVDRMLHAVVITSLPIALYGIIQQAGLDPLPWGGDVQNRVAGNMGNSIFIAAYLIMATFLTLERLFTSVAALLRSDDSGLGDALRSGAYLFVLVVQIVAIVFTQSRGPQLGLAAGLYVFSMLGLLLLARWGATQGRGPAFTRWLAMHTRGAWFGLIGLTVAGIALLVVLNIPDGPLRGVCQVRYISRTCTLFRLDEGTNAVRALIWQGVVGLMSPHAPLRAPDGTPDAFNVIRPLIGYGPESLWVAFNQFYPPELGRIESRTASPDRSHNETFDALARGGLIQLGVEIFLFVSVFYYALKWLGLIRGRRDRNIFLGFLAAGGLLGVIVPLIFDGSLRLAGIGWPVGLLAGMILFVTVDLVFSGRALATGPSATDSSGARQLLILALFSAIVAHFLEVHLGIAIVSTMTHFWVFAAALVVIGMGWVREEEVEVAAPLPAVAAPTAASQRAASRKDAGKGGRKAPPVTERRAAHPQERAPSMAPVLRRPLLALLPYALVMAIISAVFVWNYTVNQSGAQGAFAIFWNSFTTRTNGFQTVSSPMLLVLVLFTWFVGAATAIVEARDGERFGYSTGTAVGLYFGIAVVTFVVYGVIHASRVELSSLSGIDIFRRIANHVVIFDVVLFLLVIGLATGLALASARPWPGRFMRRSVASAAVTAGLAALALFVIMSVNIRSVQADTYYKQGLGYEGVGQWEGSVVLYREATRLQPQEDYYFLFLGRALLQLSDTVQSGTPVLPEDLSDIPTDRLLSLVDRAILSRTRDDILRGAHAALVGAQRLNPLNTDHAANLARLHRAWAFTGAVAPGESGDPLHLREVVAQQPDRVNLDRLARAIAYYRQAVGLSPQNAGLWNELATAQFIQGDLAGAAETINRSLGVDDRFYPTYLLLGDVRTEQNDAGAALAAYQRAAEISPRNISVLSAVGVTGAKAAQPQASVDAFQRIISLQTEALRSAQAQLAQLDQEATAAGGYENLQAGATNRRQLLEQQITGQRQQLFVAHRNLAFVLRDMGQTSEALAEAQSALQYAPPNQRADVESLIAGLQGQANQ